MNSSRAANTGYIIGLSNEVARVLFPDEQPQVHHILELESDANIKLEVISSADDKEWHCALLTPAEKLERGAAVRDTGQELTIPVGPEILGRAIDIFGQPQDGAQLKAKKSRSLYESRPLRLDQVSKHARLLATGIRAIDFFAPLVVGGKMGLFGGAGLGKTVLLSELINNVVVGHNQSNQVAIMGAVGERSRETHELLSSLKEAGVLEKTVVVLGQMGERPAVRFRTGLAAAAIAEHFRDEEQTDVLFFIDNIYRFNQAGMELATLMKTLPSEDGYQPTLNSELGRLQESLLSTEKNTITSVEAIYLPSDDIQDYGVRTVFPYLDSSVVLSRDVYQQGRLPAIDLAACSSTALSVNLIGDRHYNLYLETKRVLEKAITVERMVSLVGVHELSLDDQKIYIRSQLIKNYMTQQFTVTSPQTGRAGFQAKLSETIDDLEVIMSGQLDQTAPESLLYITNLASLNLGK